jgi:DNA primase
MARYTSDSRDRIRDAVDMVDLVGSRTELRRAGPNRYQGLCPFHEERTPSFGINPAEKLFHCFGCGEGGDCFTFVEKTEGLDFKGALEYLADRYNVRLELEEEDPQAAQRRQARERLYELLERTAAFYVRMLWESQEAAAARQYLASRGLEEGALREFRVGYAPSAWDKVFVASRRAGFSSREVYEAGLVQRAKGEGRLYDRFRRRIMFPLADSRGRVLGFGARALGADQQPKYVNTSENSIYHKGRQLFGADLARAPAAKAGSVLVAEGYTDVIALHQAGLRNTVAVMGTAMTEDQVGELARLAPVVQLALDADSAGQEAMLRAARVAAGRKLELRVVALPPGSDPADLVQAQGADAISQLVDASVPFVRFRVERTLALGDLSSAEGKDRVIEELRPVFAQLPPSVMREELARMVADKLDLSEQMAGSLLARPSASPAGGGAPPVAGAGGGGGGAHGGGSGSGERTSRGAEGSSSPSRPRPPALDRRQVTERTFLALCIAMPDRGAEMLARVEPEAHFTSEVLRRAAVHLREHLTSPTSGLPEDDEELRSLVTELAVRAARGTSHRETLVVEFLQLDLARLERDIARARSAAGGEVATLARRRGQLKSELDLAIDRAMAADAPAG